MKKTLLVILLLYTTSFTQVFPDWVQRYIANGGGATALVTDSQGNLYVTGNYDLSGGNRNIVTIKYNPEGEQQWIQIHPAGNQGGTAAIAVDADDNILITGSSNEDVVTIKYNSAGNQEWIKTYNGPLNDFDTGTAITTDIFGNAYVTGYVGTMTNALHGGEERDMVTIKYTSAGTQLWERIYGSHLNQNQRDYGTSVQADQLGNVYVAGYTTDEQNNTNAVTLKYNESGNLVWDEIYSSPANGSGARKLLIYDDENIYVAGHTLSTQGGSDYLLIKYNTEGNSQWVQTYSGPGSFSEFISSMAIDSSGNIYVTGVRGDDYGIVTIKYSPNGTQQWLQSNTLGYPNYRPSICTDADSNVYVTVESHSLSSQADYLTIKYDATGQEEWFIKYTGIVSNSNDRPTSIGIDNSGNIFVCGSSGGDFATIKYSQGFNITHPLEGDKWIAGETDTIKWTGGQAGQFLQIDYSTDDGQTYNTIDLLAQADLNEYVWNIPNNLLSTKCRIKITDAQTSTELAVSGSFKIKGYLLTRLDANGQYVAFSSAAHGWSYPNGTLWPQSWFSQFQYSTVTDPYTNEPYPNFFHSVPDSSFIDWPLWVEVFSEDQCYWFTQIPFLGSSYKGEAQEKWRANANIHNGSCFGFAASSFLAFNFRNQFFQKHPGIPNVDNIFNLNLTNLIQKTINGYYAFQFGKQSLDNDVIGQAKDPRTTLLEIMNMFKNDVIDISTITIYRSSGGAHTMAPISVVVDNTGPSRYRVNLYDSNNPGLNTPYILVDSLNNTWQNFTGLGIGWNGSNKFYLEIPVSNYLNTPVLSKMKSDISNGTNNIEFYNTEKADIIYTSSTGEKIGIVDGNLIDEISNGITIFSKNGKPSDPIGYYIPEDSYSVVMDNITESTAYLSAFKENVIYAFERFDADSTETDRFKIDEGFSIFSPDITEKESYITIIADLDTSERIFFIKDIQLRQNDSLYVKEMNQSDLIIKNFGSSKLYELEIDERSDTKEEIFQNASISLANNTTHILEPNWSDLTNSQLTIYIDEGNDGTIDDTLYVANTVDVKDEDSLLSPNSYNLAQNYPNPFNPVTTIQYSIPQRGSVIIKVYDVLGNEVATLVNEEKERGVYKATFDATGLASGLYLYRLQAGSFIETKKMILLK